MALDYPILGIFQELQKDVRLWLPFSWASQVWHVFREEVGMQLGKERPENSLSLRRKSSHCPDSTELEAELLRVDEGEKLLWQNLTVLVKPVSRTFL